MMAMKDLEAFTAPDLVVFVVIHSWAGQVKTYQPAHCTSRSQAGMDARLRMRQISISL